MLPEKSCDILEAINRNDYVHFFYRKFDTHGFGCAYLFRKFFVKHEMLDNLDLRSIRDTEIPGCKAGSYVFLCDLDITPTLIFKLCIKAKKVFVIDTKDSTVKSLIPRYKSSELLMHTNLTFIHYENISPIGLVWKLLADDLQPPSFVHDLNSSYQAEIGIREDNQTFVVKSLPTDFKAWDDITEEQTYTSQSIGKLLGDISILNARNINLRNSEAFRIKNYKCLLINANREVMDEVGIMASMAADISITYEKNDDGYYYRVYTTNEEINLLLLFSMQNCFGYNNRVWFKTDRYLFRKKRNFLQRLKDLFLP